MFFEKKQKYKLDKMFSNLLVISTAFLAFSHGSNEINVSYMFASMLYMLDSSESGAIPEKYIYAGIAAGLVCINFGALTIGARYLDKYRHKFQITM